MRGIRVEVKVKEQQSGHLVKVDSFQGTAEECADTLIRKYVGRNGYERLGLLVLEVLRK